VQYGLSQCVKSCRDKKTSVCLWPNLCTKLLSGVLVWMIVAGSFCQPITGQTPAAPGNPLILTGGTIYTSPTEKPISNGIVIIRDGRIAGVSPSGYMELRKGIPTLNCSGMTIMAGFWNSHVRFSERKWADAANIPAPELTRQLQTMLTRFGFTSVFDLGSPWENTRQIRNRIESGEIPGPRIRSTGEMLLGKGWMPSETVMRTLGSMPIQQNEVTNAAEASAASKGFWMPGRMV
jgi:hypothetical protein